ncbi:toll/interleukin-1 receptor domain-containing protein [Micromonospora chokoriensis]
MTVSRLQGHAFISYVHDDQVAVDRLQDLLEAAGIPVWRDTEDLWPGQDWKLEIKKAISDNSLVFLACISDASNAREVSYQNEELFLAAEQMRLRKPGTPWLIPVRLSDCSVPEYDLGAGRSLASIQRVDLFDDRWDRGAARLVASVLGILSNKAPAVVAVPPVVPAMSVAARIKSMLLDPNRQIELEDLVVGLANDVRRELVSDDFPMESSQLTNGPAGDRYVVQQAQRYEQVVRPLAEALAAGCTYGREEHQALWARVMQLVANADRRRSGQYSLLHLQRYPVVILTYVACMAAMLRGNYGAMRAVLADAKYRTANGPIPLIGAIHPGRPFADTVIAANLLAHEGAGKQLSDEDLNAFRTRGGKRFTPVSDHLNTLLKGYFSELLPDEEEFVEKFDELEVLFGVIAADASLEARAKNVHGVDGPWVGSFSWRHSLQRPELEMDKEFEERGSQWPPLKGGLFGGSVDRAHKAFEAFLPQAAEARWQRG